MSDHARGSNQGTTSAARSWRVAGLVAGLWGLSVVWALCGGTGEGAAYAQPGGPVETGLDDGRDDARPAETVSPEDTAPARHFPDAAPLAVDLDVERFLAGVERLAANGQELEAIRKWQQVLDGLAEVGDAAGNRRLRSFRGTPLDLRLFDGRAYATYGSVRSHVEGRLRELDRELRELHALETDGAADGLWDEFETTGRSDPLRELVTRFFNGARGDDAALRLAARALDRGRPAEAAVWLERVWHEHPDGAEHEATIVPRLVVAHARLGDLAAARTLWNDARGRVRISRRTAALVERELRRAEAHPESSSTPRTWASSAGTNDGRRLAPNVPESSFDAQLTEAWSLPFDLRPADVAPPGLTIGLPQEQRQPVRPRSPSVVEGWQELQRSPVGGAVAAGGRLYHRGKERVVCQDAETGRVVWMGRRNEPIVESLSRTFGSKRSTFDVLPRTPTPEEIELFCDMVPAEFSLHDDVLYALEGRVLEAGSESVEKTSTRTVYRRERHNELAAYDARTGRLRWQRRADEPEAPTDDAGFLAAPAVHGRRLLVPVALSGEVWLYAIARDDGRTLWRTFVCDEPFGGCTAWSPVRVVVADGRAHVLPGTGLVACLDATSGDVEWAVRYARTTFLDLSHGERRQIKAPPFDFLGWERETLVVHDRFLIVAPTDCTRLMAFDRRDGTLLWDDAGTQPGDGEPRVDRVLGLVGDRLITAGPNLLRQYDVPTGRLVWETPIDEATGDGLLTPNALYVPVGDRIVVLDPATGERRREAAFVTPTGRPLGNLVSDGHRLYAVGATRIVALAPLDDQLELLVRRIDRGDARARLQRARLFVHLDRAAEAFADLLAAAGVVDLDRDPLLAANVLETARDLGFGRSHPRETLAALVAGGLSRVAGGPVDESVRRTWNAVVHEAVATIAREELGGATAELLAAADLSGQDDVRNAVRIALVAAVRPEDRPLLAEAITSARTTEDRDEPGRRTAAIHALESERLTDVDDLLATAWESVGPFDRLAVAETRLNRGDRAGLDRLATLLAADDVAVRRRAGLLLRLSTGESHDFDARGDAGQRGEAVAAWQTWIAANGPTAELTFPVGRPLLPVGRTLVANYSKHTLTEYDLRGRAVWEAKLPSVWGCFGQRDGGRLANAYTTKTLVEFAPGDGEPEIVWRKDDLPGRPYNVQRLENGHVLVPYYDTGQIHEYDAAGQLVWQATLKGTVADARRLDDGRTLVAWYTQNCVVELDRDGNEIPGSRIDGLTGVKSAQRLPNGNTLVALYRSSRVSEVDPRGNVVWSYDGVSGASCAQRVPGGNTLIAHRTGVIEVRDDGTVVWELPGSGHARVHRY